MKNPLWQHQREAIHACLKGFEHHDRGQLIMACGSGKTLVYVELVQALDARTVLVLAPSLELIGQLREAFGSVVESIAFCHDKSVVEDHAVVHDLDHVAAFLRTPGPRVVFSTYQSAPKLEGLSFSLAIFDEAHKTAGPAGKHFSFAAFDENVKVQRRLFATATPRHSVLREDGETPVYAMNDEAIYGPVFYSLSLRRAIKRKIVCDYKIVVSVVLDDLEPERSAHQIALAKAMKKYNASKVLSYHNRIDRAKDFVVGADRTMPGVAVYHVNGRMQMGTRRGEMESFAASSRAVLTNSRCLTEGVDIPTVDMIAFMDPRSSQVDIAQAIGRALRRTKADKVGYIFLPLFLPAAAIDDFDGATLGGRFDHLYDVLQALREQDEVVAAQVSLDDWDRLDGSSLPEFSIESDTIAADQLERLKRNISVRLLRTAAGVTSAYGRKAALLKRAREGGERPSSKHERKLFEMFRLYLKPGSKVYDPRFEAELKKIRPDWLETQRTKKKALLAEILKMAKDPNCARPIRSKAKSKKISDHGFMIAGILRRTTDPKREDYDPIFTKALKKIRPQWVTGSREKRNNGWDVRRGRSG